MVKSVMENLKVLIALYEELMIIRFCCPCQVRYLDRILENITVPSCYFKSLKSKFGTLTGLMEGPFLCLHRAMYVLYVVTVISSHIRQIEMTKYCL
jgi:hypothetical protein